MEYLPLNFSIQAQGSARRSGCFILPKLNPREEKNKTKQNKTKQNKTKQSKAKQNKTKTKKPHNKSLRIAVLHCGAPAAGMNIATQVLVRMGIDAGHKIFGIRGGFSGLLEGQIEQMTWQSVTGWAQNGGSNLSIISLLFFFSPI